MNERFTEQLIYKAPSLSCEYQGSHSVNLSWCSTAREAAATRSSQMTFREQARLGCTATSIQPKINKLNLKRSPRSGQDCHSVDHDSSGKCFSNSGHRRITPGNLLNRLRYNSHTIQFTHLKHMLKWFCCIHSVMQPTPDFRTLHHTKRTPVSINNSVNQNPHFSPISPQPQGIINLLSVSIGFPLLGISHKQNHMYVLCVYFFMLSIMFPKVNYVVACISTSFPFVTKYSLLYGYTTFYLFLQGAFPTTQC